MDGEEYTFWANYTSERYLGEWKQRLERGGYAVVLLERGGHEFSGGADER